LALEARCSTTATTDTAASNETAARRTMRCGNESVNAEKSG
jgi:hypothetical protein